MKTRRILIPALVVVVAAAVAVMVYLTTNPVDTTLEFTVRDTVSKGWVWDATFRLQGRVIRAYYQSDRGVVTHKFTHLQPGEEVLEISAPSYVSQTIPVSLRRGGNRLEQPIELVGYEIPDLTKWLIVENRVGNDFVQEIRPVSSEGPAVTNHPCLDLWIGSRVSVQINNGLPAQEETQEGLDRGEELFRGVLEWDWGAIPETTFRYSSFIPGSQIEANSDPYWVIDYLIVVPDPRKISRDEIGEIMDKAWVLEPGAIDSYLEPYENQGKLTPYVFTSWNVQGGSS